MDEIIKNLHDAVLLKIEHDWQSRTCRLYFQGSPSVGEAFVIELLDVARVEFSANFPWGASSSVLEAVSADPGGIMITMQSGDTVSVQSPNYSLKQSNRSLRD
jgi:hypothetical protein